MPKVHTVQKAQKEHKCGRCSIAILPGQPYRWALKAYSTKMFRCMEHPLRPSELTSSDKLATIYGALEGVEDDIDGLEDGSISLGDLVESLEQAAEEIRNTGEEYEESASNMEQYFSGSSQIDEIHEKAEACEELASELESAARTIGDLDEALQEALEGDMTETEKATKITSLIEEARSSAEDAVGSSSL